MATTLDRNANVTKSNSDINEEILFGAPGGGSFLMDVSADGHAELIQELTDASRDKGAYAIREAVSNAFDATVKGGDLSQPVTVRIPAYIASEQVGTTLADRLAFLHDDRQFASIEDRGVGMSADELRENFAQYGNSDKRGSGAIGSKGLGSKAPLAVADFFEVVSTKDGITTKLVLWREEGGNYAKVVSEKRTGAHSGTTVRIPVSDEDARLQMEHQLVLIAGWNTKFNLDARIGSTDAMELAGGALGTELGCTYNVPLGYAAGSGYYSWTRPSLLNSDYTYMGKMPIARSSDGSDVVVDLWRNSDSISGAVNCKEGFEDSESIDVNLMGVRYPLLRNGSVGSSESDAGSCATYIIGCDPGYLNFTVSRDDIKEDDAWRALVSSLRDGMSRFDQRPALLPLLRRLSGARERYEFIRKRDIVLERRDGSYSLSGLPVSDDDATDLFSETDHETGEVIDFAPLMATYPAGERDGGIRVLWNDRGVTYGIKSGASNASQSARWRTHVMTGYVTGNPHKLSPKEIRLALAESEPRCDASAVLAAVGDRYYSVSGSCSSLDVIILTDMGPGCGKIAGAEKSIRKYICKSGSRPQEASAMYVLCEGAYEPSETEQHVLEWFGSWSISNFKDYMAECRSGVLLREKKEREAKAKAERKARMERAFHLPVASRDYHFGSGKSVLEHIADGGPANDISRCSGQYVRLDSLDAEDVVAIVKQSSEARNAAISAAWRVLEATKRVTRPNGSRHDRLVIIDTDVAEKMGIFYLGDDRAFDVLMDETGHFQGLLPDGVSIGTETVTASPEAFGLADRVDATLLTAAALRCDQYVSRRAVGSFYRIAGTTGNARLDGVLGRSGSESAWGPDTRGTGSYYYAAIPMPVRISMPEGDAGYAQARKVAARLSELWDKGIGSIAAPSLRRHVTGQEETRSVAPYAVLKQAITQLV